MIDVALLFLRDRLAAEFARVRGDAHGTAEAVVLPDGDKLDPLSLRIGAVTLMVVNVQTEPILRADDPYRRIGGGMVATVRPAIRLELWLLFVARFTAYADCWTALSTVLAFFQRFPVFTADGAGGLDPRIERLALDLRTLTLPEQNDLWNALKVSSQPALVYRAGLVVVEDRIGSVPPAVTHPPDIVVKRRG